MSGRLVLAGGVVLLLAGAHLLVLGFAARLLALPAALAGGLAVLAVVKHLGLLAPLAAWLKRRGRSIPRS